MKTSRPAVPFFGTILYLGTKGVTLRIDVALIPEHIMVFNLYILGRCKNNGDIRFGVDEKP